MILAIKKNKIGIIFFWITDTLDIFEMQLKKSAQQSAEQEFHIFVRLWVPEWTVIISMANI